MKLTFIGIFLFFSFITLSQNGKKVKLKKGEWNAELQLSNNNVLPFKLKVRKNNSISIINATEEIQLDNAKLINDSLHLRFPYFNSELIFNVRKKKITGYFVNYNKGKNYKIPFTAKKGKYSRFSAISKKSESINLSGKWKVNFEPNTDHTYPAIGIFNQNDTKNEISGTFLTETGDYRFLEGNCTEDSLYLSCFDGSHAFLFKAKYDNDSLFGKFYSGTHWQGEWDATRNDSFELTSPEELTYVLDKGPVTFQIPDLNGDTLSFPNANHKDKVVIIQIMGTWCPNCLDESIYYKELYENYHSKGLEIVDVFFSTEFEGGRHERRVNKIACS